MNPYKLKLNSYVTGFENNRGLCIHHGNLYRVISIECSNFVELEVIWHSDSSLKGARIQGVSVRELKVLK